MVAQYDVAVIGSGLGGLAAAGLLAKAGRKVVLIETHPSVGGAASTYKAGELTVEAALHETSDPKSHSDPKHHVLQRLGVLDSVQFVPADALYEVRGGPVGAPFRLPTDFAEAKQAFADRFPARAAGFATLLDEMRQVSAALGTMSRGRAAFADGSAGFGTVLKLWPVIRDWRLSLSQKLAVTLGADEAAKCAFAANLSYYHDDPDRLWWVFFAIAQGGYFGTHGHYIRGGSQRLTNAMAKAFKGFGGDLLLRREVVSIARPSPDGPFVLGHVDRDGGDRTEIRADIVVGNAAPTALAACMEGEDRDRFLAGFSSREPSISLFSITFGLSRPPSDFGVSSYSNMILPDWMTTLSDMRACAGLLGAPPADRLPVLALVDYSAIDAELGGPPYPVSVVGTDRLGNWVGLDDPAYAERRAAWQAAILGGIDRHFPGFSGAVTQTVFNTARSMASYLNNPDGSVYGFAPLPPTGPIWKGGLRRAETAVKGLYLASSYAGAGGFTGAIGSGGATADRILAGS